MHSNNQSLAQRAKSWVVSSLFNREHAGDYFEYLLEGIDPMWSTNQCKARVLDVIQETADTKTWVLQPNKRWQGFAAGQHVHLTLSVKGSLQTRTFTISSSPIRFRQDGTFTITVKKVRDGRVTGWMHDNLKENTVVILSQAQGDFVLESAAQGPVA